MSRAEWTTLSFNHFFIFLYVEKVVFFAPWRKIRRWSQVQGNSVHFEIFFTDEMRFEWVEVESDQSAYLMEVIVEFIFIMKKESEEPTFKLPKWLKNKSEKRLTWKLVKNELFSQKKEEDEEEEEEPQEEEEFINRFDNLHDEASSDEDSDGELVATASGPTRSKACYKQS